MSDVVNVRARIRSSFGRAGRRRDRLSGWASIHNGLYRLELATGRRSLRPVDVQIPHEYPEQRIVADVVDDARGGLWISAPDGLYRRWPDGTAAHRLSLTNPAQMVG